MSDLFAKTTMRGSQGLTPVALAIYYPKLQCGMEVDEVKSAGSVARDPAGTKKNREIRKEKRKDTATTLVTLLLCGEIIERDA